MKKYIKILIIFPYEKPGYIKVLTEYLKKENIGGENFMNYGYILDRFDDGEYFLRSETMTKEQALISLLKG